MLEPWLFTVTLLVPLFTVTLFGHTVIPFFKLEWAWSDFKKGSVSIAQNTCQLI